LFHLLSVGTPLGAFFVDAFGTGTDLLTEESPPPNPNSEMVLLVADGAFFGTVLEGRGFGTDLEGRGFGTDLEARDDSSTAGPPSPNKAIEGLGAGAGATFLGIDLEGRGCGTGLEGRGLGTDLDGRDDSPAAGPPSPNRDIDGLGAGAGAAFLGIGLEGRALGTGLEGRGLGTDLDCRDDSSADGPPSPNRDIEGLGAGAGAAFLGIGLEGRALGTDFDGLDSPAGLPAPSPNREIDGLGAGAGVAGRLCATAAFLSCKKYLRKERCML